MVYSLDDLQLFTNRHSFQNLRPVFAQLYLICNIVQREIDRQPPG